MKELCGHIVRLCVLLGEFRSFYVYLDLNIVWDEYFALYNTTERIDPDTDYDITCINEDDISQNNSQSNIPTQTKPLLHSAVRRSSIQILLDQNKLIPYSLRQQAPKAQHAQQTQQTQD